MRIPKVNRMFIPRLYPSRRIYPTKRFIEKENPGHEYFNNQDHSIKFMDNLWVHKLCKFSLDVGGPILGGYLFIKSMPYVFNFILKNFDKLFDMEWAQERNKRLEMEAKESLNRFRAQLKRDQEELANQLKIQNDDLKK